MYYNWMEDYEDERVSLDNQGYLIGSFINPEAVKKLLGKDGETISQTDEEFEKTSQGMFRQFREEDAARKATTTKKRKRRKIQQE